MIILISKLEIIWEPHNQATTGGFQLWIRVIFTPATIFFIYLLPNTALQLEGKNEGYYPIQLCNWRRREGGYYPIHFCN